MPSSLRRMHFEDADTRHSRPGRGQGVGMLDKDPGTHFEQTLCGERKKVCIDNK